jgi:hypothetical protein
MADPDRIAPLVEVLRLQATACNRAGSRLYGRILDGVAADVAYGGVCGRVLATDRSEPFTSALALRFLGAVHRIVLEGREERLARHYPSAGGRAGGDPVGDFLAAVERHEPEVTRRLQDGVQTNEVGRSAVLVGGYTRIARRSGLPLRIRELGASAGLNLRWDSYWYDTGRTSVGDPASELRFTSCWEGEPPDLTGPVTIADRRGCDRNPVDPTTDDGRLALLSYVWPDQRDRIDRLDAALRIARSVPVEIDRGDAVDWLEAPLAAPAPDTATVVVHSIVLQYLSRDARARVSGLLDRAGAAATPDAPVHWLRMEPAGDRADLRLTSWPGGDETHLAEAGYHGTPVRWLA